HVGQRGHERDSRPLPVLPTAAATAAAGAALGLRSTKTEESTRPAALAILLSALTAAASCATPGAARAHDQSLEWIRRKEHAFQPLLERVRIDLERPGVKRFGLLRRVRLAENNRVILDRILD